MGSAIEQVELVQPMQPIATDLRDRQRVALELLQHEFSDAEIGKALGVRREIVFRSDAEASAA